MRRTALLCLLLAGVVSLHAAVTPRPVVAEGLAGLADQLTNGLRVKAPGEISFCEKLADLVQRGEFPKKYVDSAFVYAINRGKEYPFPAFEYIIRLQASKLGVSL